MHIGQVLDRGISTDPRFRKHTPWISSPLTESAHDHSGQLLAETSPTESNSDQGIGRRRQEVPRFQQRHESSTIELFYDLFFVANLSSFSNNHEIVDKKTLRNYIGFFTILWFTWLETSLFDVRFAADSCFDRVCKAFSFAVMTGFAMVGVLYDTTNIEQNAKVFQIMSFILMASRLMLIVQYGVVLFYVRQYRNTRIPLLATMGTLLIAAAVFLGTHWGFSVVETSNHAGVEVVKLAHPDTYLAWYIVAIVEAASVITISCTWRVVSFKRTHLVERIGLLTLIMMGEGIISLTNSLSQLYWNAKTVSGSDIGVITSCVLLIYFIWVLYFDQIEHNRFGTIRQQIWAILHYPLHIGILLTVEGSSALILWNVIKRYLVAWTGVYNDVPDSVNSTQSLVQHLEDGIKAIDGWNKQSQLARFYDYHHNLTSLSNITITPYNSTEWQAEAYPILSDLLYGVFNAIFQQFGVEGPESHDHDTNESLDEKTNSLVNVFGTVFVYFYIAAGSLLVVLAILYWFGKTKKTVGEWLSIILRTVVGIGIALLCLFSFSDGRATQLLLFSSWPVAIVVICYFVVITLDNVLVWHTNKAVSKHVSHTRPAMAEAGLPAQSPESKAPGPGVSSLGSSE